MDAQADTSRPHALPVDAGRAITTKTQLPAGANSMLSMRGGRYDDVENFWVCLSSIPIISTIIISFRSFSSRYFYAVDRSRH
jgi:hypothetical protein